MYLRPSAATWGFKGRLIGPVAFRWYTDFTSGHITEDWKFEFIQRQEKFLSSKTFMLHQRPHNHTLNVYKDISGRLNRPEQRDKHSLLSSAVVYNTSICGYESTFGAFLSKVCVFYDKVYRHLACNLVDMCLHTIYHII